MCNVHTNDLKMVGRKNNDNHNLRKNGIDYTPENPRTNFFEKSISYSGAKMWNDLPAYLAAMLNGPT